MWRIEMLLLCSVAQVGDKIREALVEMKACPIKQSVASYQFTIKWYQLVSAGKV